VIVNGNSTTPISPKYITLDTSSWIDLFRRRTDLRRPDLLEVLDNLKFSKDERSYGFGSNCRRWVKETTKTLA
jgi:hypothetical protein